MSSLDKAIEIAAKAHAGATRANGTPYILHPIRVMMRHSYLVEMIVAVLHDVVEDNEDFTIDGLRQEGFSEEVLEALTVLTHVDGIPYDEYIRGIATNKLATAVKISDLRDNMNIEELPTVKDRFLSRLSKYHNALRTLQEHATTN